MASKGTRFDDVLSATSRKGETIKGFGGHDTFEFYGAAQKDRFEGGVGHDKLTGVELDMDAARAGSQMRGTTFVGGKGMDTVEFSVMLDQMTFKLGTFGAKLKSVEVRAYDVYFSGPGEPGQDTMKVIGGRASEFVTLRGFGGRDTDALEVKMGGGKDTLNVQVSSVDHIFINTGGGRDTVVMQNSVDGAEIKLGGGNDRILMDGYNRETVNAGRGNDTIVLEHKLWTVETDTVKTGAGRDKIIVDASPIVTAPLGNVVDFNEKRDKIGLTIDGNGRKPFDVVYSMKEWESEQSSNPDSYLVDYWLMDNKAGTLGHIWNGQVKEVLDFGSRTDLDDSNFFRVDEGYADDFLL